MNSIFHSETCDGEKHWILCSNPTTWDVCSDFRYCNKQCEIYINNKENVDPSVCHKIKCTKCNIVTKETQDSRQ